MFSGQRNLMGMEAFAAGLRDDDFEENEMQTALNYQPVAAPVVVAPPEVTISNPGPVSIPDVVLPGEETSPFEELGSTANLPAGGGAPVIEEGFITNVGQQFPSQYTEAESALYTPKAQPDTDYGFFTVDFSKLDSAMNELASSVAPYFDRANFITDPEIVAVKDAAKPVGVAEGIWDAAWGTAFAPISTLYGSVKNLTAAATSESPETAGQATSLLSSAVGKINAAANALAAPVQAQYDAAQQVFNGMSPKDLQTFLNPQVQSVMNYWAAQPNATASTANPMYSLFSSGYAANIAANLPDEYASQAEIISNLNSAYAGGGFDDLDPATQKQYQQQAVDMINFLIQQGRYFQAAVGMAQNAVKAQQAAAALGGPAVPGSMQGLGFFGAAAQTLSWRNVKTLVGNFSNAVNKYKAFKASKGKIKVPVVRWHGQAGPARHAAVKKSLHGFVEDHKTVLLVGAAGLALWLCLRKK